MPTEHELCESHAIGRTPVTHARAGIYASLAGYGAGAGNCPIEPSEAASERFGIDVRNILVEVGKRGLAGGQEDMIVDVALELTTVCPS